MSLYPATVTSASPLTVTMQGAASATPAAVATWSSYAPVQGQLVLVDVRADTGQVIVLGAAP